MKYKRKAVDKKIAIQAIKDYYESEMSGIEISEKYGLTESSFWKHKRKYDKQNKQEYIPSNRSQDPPINVSYKPINIATPQSEKIQQSEPRYVSEPTPQRGRKTKAHVKEFFDNVRNEAGLSSPTLPADNQNKNKNNKSGKRMAWDPIKFGLNQNVINKLNQ